MTSLKEEILEILDRFEHDDGYVYYTAAMDILEKIEKRIDEMIEETKKNQLGSGYRTYTVRALNEVKEEILK